MIYYLLNTGGDSLETVDCSMIFRSFTARDCSVEDVEIKQSTIEFEIDASMKGIVS